MAVPLQPTARPALLPWAATLAALIAFVSLLLTYGTWGGANSIILLVLSALLLSLRFTGWRLPPVWAAHWAVRLALFAPIIVFNWDKFSDPQSWLFDTTTVGAFGILAAAEFVIQAARTLPAGQSNSGALCLLSGYVFLAACTTDQIWPIRIASPLYFACAVLSLPRFGVRPRQMRDGAARRGLAVASALALGACIYTLFWVYRVPLMQLGAGSLHERPMTEATGLSQQPTLEPTFGQPGSLERVLQLQNAQGQTYLRGIAYDTYGRGRWGPIVDRHHLTSYTPLLGGGTAPSKSIRVMTLAPVRGVLFVPLQATGLFLPPNEAAFVQQDPRNGGFHIRAAVPPPYEVSFGAAHSPPLLRATLNPDERARDLAVSTDINPRVATLARQITKNSPTQAAKAAAIQQFFLRNFHYSLTLYPGRGDPVSNFILRRESGHCEFFASAAVLMLRAAGLPARYVTGYYAHDSPSPGVTLVRQQDAHAWAEVWISPQGWTTLDATPADGRPPATAQPASWPRRMAEWFSDRIAAVRAWVAQFTTGQILSVLAGLVGVYGGVRQLWRRWRRGPLETSVFSYANAAEMEDLARRFEAWLRHSGLPCPPSVPWEEHVKAAGLADALPFVRDYNTARFGVSSDPQATHDLEQEMRRLEQTKETAQSAAV